MSCLWCGWCRARLHPHLTHDPRSGSQNHHLSKNSVQKTICCNSTSNAPDDGRMHPKHFELSELQQVTLLHQAGISLYFVMKMHGQTTLKIFAYVKLSYAGLDCSSKAYQFVQQCKDST